MGKSTTPKYVVVLHDRLPNGALKRTEFTWDCKTYGHPTDANLEKFVLTYGKSLESGGVNFHISEALGHIPYPNRAFVRTNDYRKITVAEWKAAMFQVW